MIARFRILLESGVAEFMQAVKSIDNTLAWQGKLTFQNENYSNS